MDDVAIKVDNVSKSFKLPHEKNSSLKSSVINFTRSKSYEMQQALKDVSFEVKNGEFFGIVGRNGSGKSTLLKLIAGIYVPTTGDIKINGSLTPFIELGVGFNPELTGRENVYLNGALLGFNRKEMQTMYGDIVEFAELKKFMDQKLKNYSSGMQVRLAFSIAIRARGDILLLDEVLAVGDGAFQQKCLDYFVERKRARKTTVLVSHNMQIIEQFCDRVVFIEGGVIKKIGDGSEIAGMYEEMFLREDAQRLRQERNESNSPDKDATVKVLSTKVLQAGKEVKEVKAGKDFEIQIAIQSKQDLDKANVGINIKNRGKVMIISTDTEVNGKQVSLQKGVTKTVVFKLQTILANGLYSVNVGIADNSDIIPKVLERVENSKTFSVTGGRSRAIIEPTVRVEVI